MTAWILQCREAGGHRNNSVPTCQVSVSKALPFWFGIQLLVGGSSREMREHKK